VSTRPTWGGAGRLEPSEPLGEGVSRPLAAVLARP
jgi:hypothetical protein